MVDPDNADGVSASIRIEMLDHSSGRPVSHWIFENAVEIAIGRSPDQDVEISDPYVSRHHASLLLRDGNWILLSFGRNGVLVANQHVKEHLLEDGMLFRLGVEGPTLKFAYSHKSDSPSATINFSEDDLGFLNLSEAQIERDVGEVTDGDYFRKIQDLANKLRGNRTED
jgi:hypothetical protein